MRHSVVANADRTCPFIAIVRIFKLPKDMPFPDGDAPPKAVVEAWLSVCKKVFKHSTGVDQPAIGIHCVAGLGRAPILVCIALIESGMDAVSAVTLIRNKRKGAINRMQLQYLKKYKKSGGCVIL